MAEVVEGEQLGRAVVGEQRTVVSEALSALSPIHRHHGTSSASRTNQPITKAWVTTMTVRSTSPTRPSSVTAPCRSRPPTSASSAGTVRKSTSYR